MGNDTILTLEMYKKFLRKQTKVSMIIIRVCYSILFFLGLSTTFLNFAYPNEAGWGFVAYCLIMGAFFALYDIFLVPLNLKLSKSKNLIGCNYHFEFNENDFNMTVTKNDSLILESKLNYNIIYKVVFNENYIYIYMNRVNAYIVDKNGFKSDEERTKTIALLLKFVNNKTRQKQF
ncbi:MAG: YcxB family protein [Christensenellales bacterium]